MARAPFRWADHQRDVDPGAGWTFIDWDSQWELSVVHEQFETYGFRDWLFMVKSDGTMRLYYRPDDPDSDETGLRLALDPMT